MISKKERKSKKKEGIESENEIGKKFAKSSNVSTSLSHFFFKLLESGKMMKKTAFECYKKKWFETNYM